MAITLARWLAGTVGLAVALCVCAPAQAAPWSPPVDGFRVVLGYGEKSASGVHRGVDLSAPAGAGVAAPVGGVVTFAGSVPAHGGGTCVAVTIELPDGKRLSLLPLDGAALVREGQTVAAGEPLGVLRASGDGSSETPHLHVSLRQGDLYLDPAPYLPQTADDSAAVGEQGAPPSGLSADGGSSAASAAASAAGSASVSTAGAGPVSATAGVSVCVEPPARPIAVASAMTGSQAVQGSMEPASIDSPGVSRAVIAESGTPQASALDPSARRSKVRAQGSFSSLPPKVLGTGLAMAVMLAAAAGIAATRRAALVRVG